MSNPLAVHSSASQIRFGNVGNIPLASGDYFQISNPGYATITFHIEPADSHCVEYQGSFDGQNFDAITFRQIGSDGYTQHAHNGPENVIGSVIGTQFIRFVNVSGASSAGTVIGTLSNGTAIIEGIEHAAPPHKFGHRLFHRGFSMSGTAFANSGLYTPPAGHKFVLTYLSMSIASTAGSNVTFHEGSGTAGNPDAWIYATYVKVAASDTQIVNANLNTPFVASTFNAPLCVTSDGVATIRGVLHGYDAEN